jgi:pyridoxamine 5'-phosphate oxidase
MPRPPHEDPLHWFDAWYGEALRTIAPEPNAVALATADARGRPSCRMVLLKSWDRHGFVFFTNRRSRKGRQLSENPHGALTFWWRELERQIRIEGEVEKISDDESDEYFASRARGSQIGAWASKQSSELDDREKLIERVREFEERYPDDVPRPSHWGGYRLVPLRMEFWASGEHRLHDRFEYTRSAPEQEWSARRLFP